MRRLKTIYTLSHPITKAIVYVGITKSMRMRVAHHYNCPTATLLPFITELKALGLKPVIKKIDKGDAENEIYWINRLLLDGHQLVNKVNVFPPEERVVMTGVYGLMIKARIENKTENNGPTQKLKQSA